jgi:long-chain acyl-CoA synthetase
MDAGVPGWNSKCCGATSRAVVTTRSTVPGRPVTVKAAARKNPRRRKLSMANRVWEQWYPAGVTWDLPLPPAAPLENLLEETAQRLPDAVAINFYDRAFTYRELRQLAAQAAKGLQLLGVGPGVNVGLHLPNSPHFIICFFAVLMAGGRVVTFSPLAAPRELKRQLEDAETQVMVTMNLPTLYPQIAALKGTAKFETLVVCRLEEALPAVAASIFGPSASRVPGLGREVEFAELTANDGRVRPYAHGPLEDEVAVLQYTGGTTGEPKGAMLTHANFCVVVNVLNAWFGERRQGQIDKTLAVLPLFHIFGLSCIMLLAIANGNEIVLHLRFDAERVLADISAKKITSFPGVPTMYTALINHPKFTEFDLSSVSMWSSGGAPLPLDVQQRFETLTGHSPREGYGLTETAPLGTLSVPEGPVRQGSVGVPAPHTLIEVVDLDTGSTPLSPGEIGEICLRGPQVMKGYWKNPLATEQALRGGRFHTGDIGFMSPDGFLTLVDRKKDMILSSGYNVFPRNVEEAIYEHPGVAEVTVIGVPDSYRGQSAKAFIVLKPGCTPFDLEALRSFLADKLATYEMPTAMEIRASLPKTPVGKLSKKELVAEELAKRQSAPT